MDYQNRVGSKFGGGGPAGNSEANVDRRERLRKLAMETIDLAKDPYILRTHLGTIECRLCLTLHTNEGSYLAHTQGKKHQTNLARRAARDNKDNQLLITLPKTQEVLKKNFVKIGRPGYKVTKIREPTAPHRLGLLFQANLPEIKDGVRPIRRFMSAFEQRREIPNRAIQYLLIAAEPYETIAFAIPAREIVSEDSEDIADLNATWDHWDNDTKTYYTQLLFNS
ncbi:splicing factor 3a subunit 2 [Phaffia rhodozyma]|uniref:Splicing factor 3a subunit 2 n=1 Tax=Phaffia rhodozyma TaxID=264483 RepID=A0A0F7SHK5_PHARH|nr:splicing factor 3a subunit 2 [Phaffia rhodozyma]